MNQTDSIVKVKINTKVVNCSGGKGTTGHPTVYYNFGKKKKNSMSILWGNIFKIKLVKKKYFVKLKNARIDYLDRK